MSTDRELLEAAAKAAGYEFVRHSECGDGVLLAGIQDAWRPLVDDGDAIRLAVKLRMAMDSGEFWVRAMATPYISAREDVDGDPYAATRRAIVRAAASMAPKETP